MVVLFLASSIVFIMTVWFKTDGIVEWADILGLGFVLQTDKYREAKIAAAPNLLTYPNYLRNAHNHFLSRLLCCPICLSAWLAMVGSLVSLTISSFPIIWVISIILYGTVNKLV